MKEMEEAFSSHLFVFIAGDSAALFLDLLLCFLVSPSTQLPTHFINRKLISFCGGDKEECWPKLHLMLICGFSPLSYWCTETVTVLNAGY